MVFFYAEMGFTSRACYVQLLYCLTCLLYFNCIPKISTCSEINCNKILVQGGLHTEEGWVESVFYFWVSLLFKRRMDIERKFGKIGKNIRN